MKVSPDPDKLEEAADRLLDIHENMGPEKTIVDFGETHVDPLHMGRPSCGTVACHAGWLIPALSGDVTTEAVASHQGTWYTVGEAMMDEWLGFSVAGDDDDDIGHFANWAEDNPALWGNEYGGRMYNSYGYGAFGGKENHVTLETIANWYKDVAKRIRESENED